LIDKISSQKMKFMGTGSLLPWWSLSSTIWSIISQLPTITRGDIIVFVPPGKDIHYIKRVIGLPGETVHILENGVQICQTTDPKNCFILDEPYLPKEYRTLPACGISDFIVSDGFFVMGDNREHSTDSRCCFTIWCYSDSESTGGIKWYIAPYRYIIWKVWVRIVPTFTWY
jgi:signal peptidase I